MNNSDRKKIEMSPASGSSVGLPPLEVVVRTMASDVQALRESGGTLNRQPERIIVPVEGTGEIKGESREKETSSPKPLRLVLWLIAAFIAIAALFLMGYYFLPSFFPR